MSNSDYISDKISIGIENDSAVLRKICINFVIFRLQDKSLTALLRKDYLGQEDGKWTLPGGLLHSNLNINESASLHLQQLIGIKNIYFEQFQTFGATNKIPITIAYYALIRQKDLESIMAANSNWRMQWMNVDPIPPLIEDHAQILLLAIGALRSKAINFPVAFLLLPEKFTFLELQELYELILNVRYTKSNFRRKMAKLNILTSIDQKQEAVAHRAAAFYSFDEKTVLILCKQ